MASQGTDRIQLRRIDCTYLHLDLVRCDLKVQRLHEVNRKVPSVINATVVAQEVLHVRT